ncbi:MAG: hypothetical protein JXQ73_29930 [Phycisphaerae bacterium]|nr:hypothetical protein [Phycisphaerae bacterium]
MMLASCFVRVFLPVLAFGAGPASGGVVGEMGASVLDCGARADGKTDDTGAFQKALDAAAGGGGVVRVPAGTYLIAGSLTVPQGVALRGAWEGPHHTDIGKGSVLYATGGAGDENGKPLISLNQSSCVRGLTIFYPNQDIDNVKAYPWTIQGRGMHCSVIDVTLANPYKGIDFGTHPNELHTVRNVYGCPLRLGVYVNQTTDIGRIEDVHFNPHYWMRANHPSAPKEGTPRMQKLFTYLEEHLVGFEIGRTDWEYMVNCFVIFPRIGYHFVETKSGMPNAVLTQCGSDIGPVAVQVDASQGHAGIAFSNSQFMATVKVGPKNRGPVKFSNCGFWPIAKTNEQAVIEGAGTVTFSSCHFADWGRRDRAAPCILVRGGSAIVSGCQFLAARKTQIELGEGTRSAVILGNQFRGGERVVNKSKAGSKIQMGFNVD